MVSSPIKSRRELGKRGSEGPETAGWRSASCLAAGFMTLLDVSIVNVALPSIEQGLHAQPNELQWIVAGYALALGLLLVPAGASATRTAGGRCSWSAWRCSWSRARPARWRRRRSARGDAARPGVRRRSHQPADLGPHPEPVPGRGARQGVRLFGATIACRPRSARSRRRADRAVRRPRGLAGGVLRQPADRAAILLLARRYLPAPTAAERRPQALDPLGVVLLGAAVVCILVPFIEQRTWHGPLRLALFPLAAVLLVVWVLHERRYGRTREPLVSLDLFRIRSYVLGAPVGLLYFAGFVAMFFILTQYLQLGLDYPAWKSRLAATALRPRRRCWFARRGPSGRRCVPRSASAHFTGGAGCDEARASHSRQDARSGPRADVPTSEHREQYSPNA
jgi:MFS family permease